MGKNIVTDVHFEAKCLAFCGKTHYIMRQNAKHYAAKRMTLCGKMQPHFAAKCNPILRQNAIRLKKVEKTIVV